MDSHSTRRDEAQRALQRVGKTAEEQAQWLLDVGYGPKYLFGVNGLTPAERRALGWEMAAFCHNNWPGLLQPFSEAEVLRWLPRIHNGVQQLHEGRAWGHHLVTHCGFWIPTDRQVRQKGFWPHWWDGDSPPPGRIEPKEKDVLEVNRTLKDRMAHRICDVLLAVGHRLRRCQNLECGRLFVRQRRQLYCTPACAAVLRIRNYRAKQRRATKV
jgi:hypothetical protein